VAVLPDIVAGEVFDMRDGEIQAPTGRHIAEPDHAKCDVTLQCEPVCGP
jgi:hypothetical protein